MTTHIDTRRILIFLAFAFGIAWALALTIYLTGLSDSPVIIPGFLNLAAALMIGYMFAPALAHVFTRLLTREGWHYTFLRPHFKRGAWKYWLAAWLLPPALIMVGTAIYFAIFAENFDPTMPLVANQMEALGQEVTPTLLWAVALSGIVQGILLAPVVNGIPTFGEEFGWRAYLQPKLMPLGGRTAMLLMGLIWGVWHWPLIFMGYEYGREYIGAPWAGPLVWLLIALMLGAVIGWLALKGRSVWPAVIAHAMFNGFAQLALLFVPTPILEQIMQGAYPYALLGPLPVGVVTAIPLAILTLWILLSPKALIPAEEASSDPVSAPDLVTKPA